MGRVARYKKVKAFDTFAKNGTLMQDVWGLGNNGRKKKKRSMTAAKLREQKMNRKRKRRGGGFDDGEGDAFDLPPNAADEFDMLDLVGSIKKESVPKNSNPLSKEEDVTNGTPTGSSVAPTLASNQETIRFDIPKSAEAIPEEVQNEIREAKFLKITPEEDAMRKSTPNLQRMPGESKSAFKRRMKAELEDGIIADRLKKQARNTEKKKKKKEFLNNKKKKKKKKGKGGQGFVEDEEGGVLRSSGGYGNMNDQNDDGVGNTSGGLITGEMAVAAAAKASTEVAFGEQAERPPTFAMLPRGATKKNTSNKNKHTKRGGSGGTSAAQIKAEQHAMDNLRRKVQTQYALVKAKRKRQGDFHL